MRLIVTTGMAEAKPLIQYYGLKKVLEAVPFPLYQGAADLLCVCGEDLFPITIATAYLAGRAQVPDPWLVFIEKTAHTDVFYPHALFDPETSRAYYPEMLYRHPFTEGVLESSEAACFWKTALKLTPAHQILLLAAPAESIFKSVAPWLDAICDFSKSGLLFTEAEQKTIQAVCQKLHLTAAMQAALEKTCRVYKSQNENTLAEFLNAHLKMLENIVIQEKREGKTHFDQLQRRLLE